LKLIEYHSTGFGRSFCPSSGVQDCTHSIRYMSYGLVECLLACTRWNSTVLGGSPYCFPALWIFAIYFDGYVIGR